MLEVHRWLLQDTVRFPRGHPPLVLDPTDRDTRSDGSFFFMNPVVTPSQFDELLIRAGTKNVPHFPSSDEIKLSAAWLIEHSGFHKGFVHGNVGLSSKHTLAVVIGVGVRRPRWWNW